MLLSVIADYADSPIKKLLQVNEEYGSIQIHYLDASDASALQELYEKQNDGLSYTNFKILKDKTLEGKDCYELQYSCSNRAPGEPDLSQDGYTLKDPPSFLGFLRKLVLERGLIVLPFNNVPKQDIPYWMTASANTIQFTNSMGIKISSLIPGEEEGYWRWTTSTLFSLSWRDEPSDVTNLIFLTFSDFNPEEYEPYLVEHEGVRVVQENGHSVTYRAFSVKKDLPIYIRKSNSLVTPSMISHLKYVADSYKLALYTLTDGLFQEKKIESKPGDYYYNQSVAGGRFLKFETSPPIKKQTANIMTEFYLMKARGNLTTEEINDFIKKYPHYPIFASIIEAKLPIFYSDEWSKNKKFRTYQALKNIETFYNLLLQECRHHVMFDNNGFLFNFWSRNRLFKSDIPNYNIKISGGGGTWHPTY